MIKNMLLLTSACMLFFVYWDIGLCGTLETSSSNAVAVSRSEVAEVKKVRKEFWEDVKEIFQLAEVSVSPAPDGSLGSVDCSLVQDFDLRSYCNSGRCSDLMDDFDLYSFCEEDNVFATYKLARRMGIIYDSFAKYYKTGDVLFFAGEQVEGIGIYSLPEIAKKYAGSKQSRKEFIIYLWRGTILH